jgi:hypothetical protein
MLAGVVTAILWAALSPATMGDSGLETFGGSFGSLRTNDDGLLLKPVGPRSIPAMGGGIIIPEVNLEELRIVAREAGQHVIWRQLYIQLVTSPQIVL